jgi:uroporphyrinogen III methyltransferase/synthase
MSGRVFLVGAGPGDPGLLTVKGRRCLETADVVVHDHLVPARLLACVRPGVEVIALGTPHGTGDRLRQGDIEALLVARARAGLSVVRLKNGDPFVFGRGGEEASALKRAGVAFEVVPGVSAAIAVPAYAGIPLTHRDHASTVTVITGHQAGCGQERDGASLPWNELARQGGTLVILMGMRELATIMAALATHGLSADTPAAAIRWGTTGRQTTVTATVGTLAARVEEARLCAPAVVVVGSVVGLAHELAWFESRPLFGRRIVVTRPRAQAEELARLLEDQGAEVILFPTIEIAPPPDAAPFERAVEEAATYDWIVFTSANGVRVFFERFVLGRRDLRELARVRLAAIGPETAAELERRLLRPAVVAAEFRAEGLIAALAAEDVRGKRFLLPRAAGARPVLPETLSARGARVEDVVAYQAVQPSGADVASVRTALAAGEIDALTFTSSSTVANFVAMVGRDEVARLIVGGRPLVACIGPVTADTARAHGLSVAVEARVYTSAGLSAALGEHFCNASADPLCREGR